MLLTTQSSKGFWGVPWEPDTPQNVWWVVMKFNLLPLPKLSAPLFIGEDLE